MKFVVVVAYTALLVLCFDTLVEARIGRRRLQHRKLYWADDDVAIQEQFLIVFDDNDTAQEVQDFLADWRAQVLEEYDSSALRGAVVKVSSTNSLINILDDKRVALVQEVGRVIRRNLSLRRCNTNAEPLFSTGFCV